MYYRPGKHVILGGGIIANIETEKTAHDTADSTLTEYYTHIDHYHEVYPPLEVRGLRNRISFLKDGDGLRGVPQNSIYEISRQDFEATAEASGIDAVLPDNDPSSLNGI